MNNWFVDVGRAVTVGRTTWSLRVICEMDCMANSLKFG